MTYVAKEQGLYTGNPQELFKFSYGDTPTELFYTSSDETESYGGDSYVPYPITRSSLGLGSDKLTLTVPIDCPLVLSRRRRPAATGKLAGNLLVPKHEEWE